MATETTRPLHEDSVVSQMQPGAESRATLALEGMTCASCAMRIEKDSKATGRQRGQRQFRHGAGHRYVRSISDRPRADGEISGRHWVQGDPSGYTCPKAGAS